ncbi:MAG: hypothetical protein QM777_26605 [Pseudorhodoferax sp.]
MQLGPALVDQRGHARAHAAQVGVHAEAARHALVDMAVGVDQARQHQLAAAVHALGVGRHRGTQVVADGGDAPVGHENVEYAVAAGAGVDHPAPLQNHAGHLSCLLPVRW